MQEHTPAQYFNNLFLAYWEKEQKNSLLRSTTPGDPETNWIIGRFFESCANVPPRHPISKSLIFLAGPRAGASSEGDISPKHSSLGFPGTDRGSAPTDTSFGLRTVRDSHGRLTRSNSVGPQSVGPNSAGGPGRSFGAQSVGRDTDYQRLDDCYSSVSDATDSGDLRPVVAVASKLYKRQKIHNLAVLKLCFTVAIVRAEKHAADRALEVAEESMQPVLATLQEVLEELEAMDLQIATCPDPQQRERLRRTQEELEAQVEGDQEGFQKLEVAKEVVLMQVMALNARLARVENELKTMSSVDDCAEFNFECKDEEIEYLELCERKQHADSVLEMAAKALAPQVEATEADLELLEEKEGLLAIMETEGNSEEVEELRSTINALDQRLETQAWFVQQAEASVEIAQIESERLRNKVLELESFISELPKWRRWHPTTSTNVPDVSVETSAAGLATRACYSKQKFDHRGGLYWKLDDKDVLNQELAAVTNAQPPQQAC